jgi:hypothetical protein
MYSSVIVIGIAGFHPADGGWDATTALAASTRYNNLRSLSSLSNQSSF